MRVYFVAERLNRIPDPAKAAQRGEIRIGDLTLRLVERGAKIFIRGTREAIAAYQAQFGDGVPDGLG